MDDTVRSYVTREVHKHRKIPRKFATSKIQNKLHIRTNERTDVLCIRHNI